MTLISALVFDGTFWAVSDALLTYDCIVPAQDINFPLSGIQSAHLRNQTLAGLTQKAILLDRRELNLWAGNRNIAIEFISEFAQRRREFEGADFLDVKNHILYGNQSNHVSFIYAKMDDPYLSIEGDPRKIVLGPEAILYTSGSGEDDYFNAAINNGARKTSKNEIVGEYIFRLSSAVLRNVFSDDTLEHSYGGWFEIVDKFDGGFRKLPYLVKLWAFESDDVLLDKGGHVCWYERYHLRIMSFTANGHGYDFSTHIIPDPLDRFPQDNLSTVLPAEMPVLQFHLLYRGSNQWSILTGHFDPNDFRIEVKDNQWRSFTGKNLFQALLAARKGEVQDFGGTYSFRDF